MRFLISGYYGFENVGDEALLRVIVAGLRTRFPLATIEALSATPEATAYDYGIEAAPRWDQAAIRAAVTRADALISGGGGLLQNSTSLKSLIYYAGIVQTAIRAGKKTMVFAQSIGPLDFFGKQTVRKLCKGLGAATVRDERSRALLAPLLPATPVERTADPVFTYDPPETEAPGPADVADDGQPLAVVCVRKTANFSDGVPVIAAAVDRLARAHGVRTVFLPFGGSADAEAATLVIRKCASQPMLLPAGDLAAIARTIARARLVVGVRLHALILAIRFGVPFLAVPYDPKVTGLVEDIGYPLPALWTPGMRSVPAFVERLVDEAWTRRDELTALVARACDAQRRLAGRNFDVLAELCAR